MNILNGISGLFRKAIVLSISAFMLTACHESLEDRAAREAVEYTKKYCPTPVKDNVITDSLTYQKATRTISYWYTLCNAADNKQAIDQNKEKLVNTLLEGVRASTQLKTYKDAGFNIRYVYHSQKSPQSVLLDVTFTDQDYQTKD